MPRVQPIARLAVRSPAVTVASLLVQISLAALVGAARQAELENVRVGRPAERVPGLRREALARLA